MKRREFREGFCKCGERPMVAKACLHMWEEPCISGTRGSGAVFFSGCNLGCVYCQNYQLSHGVFGREVSVSQLSRIYDALAGQGAHNINLVNPSHFVPQIAQSLKEFRGRRTGLPTLPVVYNTSGYDSLENLRGMENLADVYLPDLKYFSPEASLKYSGAEDYFSVASEAVLEMYRQVGPPVLDGDGLIRSGLVVRHLILPGLADDSCRILDWIAGNLPGKVYVSLMSQYVPYGGACAYPEIDRRITRHEYEKVKRHLFRLGLENGYIQERESASESYIPDFDLGGVEF